MKSLTAVISIIFFFCGCGQSQDSLSISDDRIYIEIDKSEYILTIMSDTLVIKQYPNEHSWAKHNKAKSDGVIEETAGIGGEIGIHGVPRGSDEIIDLGMNWTLGCISLKNKDRHPGYHRTIAIA